MTQRPIQRAQYTLPPVQANYILNPERGFFSVVVPEATTNLITNPSVEVATTGYSANAGATLSRTTDYQRHGVYGLQIDPTAAINDGVLFSLDLFGDVTYTFSADVYGVPGAKYSLVAYLGAAITSTTVIGRGYWERVSVSFTTGAADATYTLGFIKNNSTSTKTFYTDGWQCEEDKAYPTTYCDGDQVGFVANQYPPAYLWTGLPHASTSIRSAQTRAGGRVFNLDAYGFRVAAYIGLGIAAVSNIAQPYALLDGAQYQRTVQQSRPFTISGRFDAATFPQLQRQRSDLYDTVKRDAVALQQSMILKYQAYDCMEPIGEELNLICNYEDGLRGNTDNLNVEDTPITFTMYLPNVRLAGEEGRELGALTETSDANYILRRDNGGSWFAMGTGGAGGDVRDILVGQAGRVYVGGQFTGMDSVANTARIAYYDTATGIWSAMGTGAPNNAVVAIVQGPDGYIYAGGSFLSMGGIATTRSLARWSGSVWASIGEADSGINALAVDRTGNLFAGGAFANIGGVAAANIAKRTPAGVWSALAGYPGGVVEAIVIGPDNALYVGASQVYKYSGGAWTALGSSGGGTVYSLTFGPDGVLYALGSFASMGSISAACAARYNGVAWQPLGSGLNAAAYSSAWDIQRNMLIVGGVMTTAGGLTLSDGVAYWNGSAWIGAEVNLPGSSTVYATTPTSTGSLYLGFSTSGTAENAVAIIVNNRGTTNSYPVLTIKAVATSRIYQIYNYTTGKAVYFNYVINAGETATFNFDPLNYSFTSDFQGNLLSTIIPGSQQSEMFLVPGDNGISFFASLSTANVTPRLYWTPAYNSVDDAAR